MGFWRRLKNRYYTIFLGIRIVLPVFVTILVILFLISIGIFYSVIHPPRSLEVIDPSAYQMYAVDITWDGANGDTMQGWFIRSSNQAPLIILCHGYGTNRTEVLSLASRLKDYGYNVFLYNLRGHGTSSYHVSSLGLWETEDLKNALKIVSQRPEVDFTRIGIYGSSLGAYIALSASKGNPNVKALVLDSIYPSIDSFIYINVQRVVGLKTALLSNIVSLVYDVYFSIPPSRAKQVFSPDAFRDKSILFITGQDKASIELARETRKIYTYMHCNKEILNLATSRESILFGDDKRRYDLFVLDFFKKELPLVEEAVKIDFENPPK